MLVFLPSSLLYRCLNFTKSSFLYLFALIAMGCSDTGGSNSSNDTVPDLPSAIFDLESRQFPLAVDLFASDLDGTFDITVDEFNPVLQALDQLDGFSTIAGIDIAFDAPLASDSLRPSQNVLLLNTQNQELAPIEARAITLTDGTPILRILPTEPLAPGVRYLVVLTNTIESTSNESIDLPDFYRLAQIRTTDITVIFQEWMSAGNELLEAAGINEELALSFSFTTTNAFSVFSQIGVNEEFVRSRAIDWIDIQPQTSDTIDGLPLFSESGDDLTQVFQGQIQLPQFIDDPVINSGQISEALLDSIWENDQGNITAQNPFPSLVTLDSLPILMVMPGGDYSTLGGADCSSLESVSVAVFIHGITANRSVSLIPAQFLASQACIATVVIDHPGHGMAPVFFDSDNQALLSELTPLLSVDPEFSDGASPWATAIQALATDNEDTFLNLQERHKNIGLLESGERSPFIYSSDVDEALGSSGSHFIVLSNFARTRDNLRQAVLDQLNVLASLSSVSLNNVNIDMDNVHVIGHSLGAIVALALGGIHASILDVDENSPLPDIQTLTAANAGGHLTKLLENSPFFRSSILNGLSAAGIEQGSESFERYLQVFQAMVDSMDAVNYSQEIDRPTLLFEMVGGGFINNDDVNLPSQFPLIFSQLYPNDHIVPNFSYFGVENNPYALVFDDAFIETSFSPLAGTDPLARIMSLEEVNQVDSIPDSQRLLAIFQAGTHSTLVSADDEAVFLEMMKQIVSMIQGGYQVDDNTLLAEP